MPEGLWPVLLLCAVLSVLGIAGRRRARRVETKAVRYSAPTIDDVQRRYHADASLSYTRTGWTVHSMAWDVQAKEPTLMVTYARREREPSRILTTVVATLSLTTVWLLISELGYLLYVAMRLDLREPGLLLGFLCWPIVAVIVLRVRRHSGALSWTVVALGSLILSLPIWFFTSLFMAVEIYGLR